MEGHVLHHQQLIPTDFPIPSEAQCLDEQYSAHPVPSTYPHDASVDQFRRDGTLPQPAASPFSHQASHTVPGPRLYSENGIAADATASYQSANIYTDTSSGSISSPTSAGSTVPQNAYYASDTATPRYTTYSGLPGSVVVHPQAFPQSTYASARYPVYQSVPPPNDSLQSLRHSIGDHSNAVHRSSYPATPQYLSRTTQLVNGYASYAQTPRTVHSTGFPPFSPGPPSYMGDGGQGNMARSANECSEFKFPDLSCQLEMRCNDQSLTPDITAKVEKGFFLSEADGKWTCYRRNYFSVHVGFKLNCNTNNAPLFLKHRSKEDQISAMGMRLSAAVDAPSGKNIELIQHTPKRDLGPKSAIDIVRVSPQANTGRTDTLSPNQIYQVPMGTFHPTGAVPGPFLPLQNVSDPNDDSSDSQQKGHSQNHSSMPLGYSGSTSHMTVPGQSTQHTFERIQFKQATANNGKRRASQQYFHLIVELFADTRKDASEENKWIKVAHRTSENIVVRGRSPSHYQNESHGQANRGGSANGGGYGGGSGVSGYASINGVGYPSSGGGYGGSLSSSSGHRGPNYTYNAADGRGSSSPESDFGQPGDGGLQPNPLIPEADRVGATAHSGYRYHPGPLYDQVPAQFRLPKFESTGQSSTDPRQYAFKTELPDAVPGAQWQANGCERYQGFPSSQGWIPQLPSASGIS